MIKGQNKARSHALNHSSCKELSVTYLILFQYAILITQCNELCKIARALNSTAISKYVTLKMTDVPSKHVWKIKESCYVYTNSRVEVDAHCFDLSSRYDD